jgi:hypothetical protein
MPRPTQEQIDALKAKHGPELTLVTLDRKEGVYFVVRPPSPAEYDRFMDRVAEDPKKRPMAIKELGLTCAIYPEPEAREAFYSRKPGATTTLATKALELAGLTEEDSEKL